MEFPQALAHLKAVLRAGDLRGALMFLNSLTTHRFSSLYRFDGATLRNVVFFDRQNPGQERCDDLPVMASYCVYVRDAAETFNVADSLGDRRVAGHPKQQQIRAYCGVPLLDDSGRMFGSICHFDTVPRATREEDVALMEALAPLLARYCPVTA